jgi:hypothetical protein
VVRGRDGIDDERVELGAAVDDDTACALPETPVERRVEDLGLPRFDGQGR